ncbi:hypothetical protein C3K47_11795 [Solitalea longa]|uniref:Uncharacterized protein n=1 Tax=Solitalea longa TaxID=2079460 RepID=A0A2S5A1G1_9SPHI|nr:hypothetical protein [Solitalea longa]POY36421.1 hypothetical protein C3K47_11795 [Solitalea longa]
MKDNSTIYHFKYEGDFHSVDALTILHTQLNFISILTEIKDQIYPEVKLNIKLQGLEKGSLDVQHVVEIATVSGMFVMENYSYISKIFEVFGDLVKLKSFLKGEKATETKEVGNDKIEIHIKGDNITIHPDAFKMEIDL